VEEDVRPIEIPPPAKLLSPPIIAFDDVSFAYEPGRPVLRRLTLRVDPADRIALLGANGNGKSTLVKLIAGRLTPSGGMVTRADKLAVAYFAQNQLDELVSGQTVYDHVRRLMPDAPEANVRARAGSIGFPGAAADSAVENLSGGEKSRLLIGLATLGGPHLVILDEPTNHLDIDSRAALIEAINSYPGAVMLVAHDRYLIEACAERLWLVAGGTVAAFDGDLDDYRRQTLALRGGGESEHRSAARAPSRADQRRAAAVRRAELAPLRARISAAEAAIGRLSAELAHLDAALAAPGAFGDPARAASLAKARADTARALAAAEDDWFDASTAYDAAMA
jgi:ATP-binding cassette subfamily F protein 3